MLDSIIKMEIKKAINSPKQQKGDKNLKINVLTKHKKRDITVYIVLRFLVILIMILQIIRGNFENVFMCILTLILFTIPALLERRLNIELPDALETIILLFIFSSAILGEIQNFYGTFNNWDTMLHTINGFLCAAIGFSFIDILNRSEKLYTKMTPVFVAMVAFCFSMTIGVLWEFYEFGMDNIVKLDMQKDKIVKQISSVKLNPEGENKPVVINDINQTIIKYQDDKELVIDGGYLDIGIKDTMKDLLVNFIGALVFSVIGLLYIKDRDKYKFAEKFMPKIKKKESKV